MYIPVSYKKNFDELYDTLEKVNKALHDIVAVCDDYNPDEAMSHSWDLLDYVIIKYNDALKGVSEKGADGYNSLLPRETLWEKAKEEFRNQYVELTVMTMRFNIEVLTIGFTNNENFPELSKEKIGSDFKNVLDNLCGTVQHTFNDKQNDTQK